MRRAIRDWFARENFLEVETPLRVPSPGQEVHLDAIAADAGRFLITSPEYHMKRLVAAGLPRIFQMERCFRAGERGPHHQPEFTMIEWYRAGASLEVIATDCERLVEVAARAVGRWPITQTGQGAPIELQPPFERTTVAALLQRHAHLLLTGAETAAELAEKARVAGLDIGSAVAWDDIFFQVFLDRVEPNVGARHPTFVLDWPAPLGALARPKPGNPNLVERFELYAGGLELANAFGELIDPIEQRRRFTEETTHRKSLGKAVYPIDEKLLSALALMPPTSGVALGFDRLMMLVLGAADIREVMAFADDEV